MNSEIKGLTDWLKTPPGRYLLDWERSRFDEAVSDIFGYHALQLGLPEIDTLRANRMPHKWLAATGASKETTSATGHVGPVNQMGPDGISSLHAALLTDPAALPFPENSLDLVVLPHTLELDQDPHFALSEVERVLVPDGRVVISGLNPVSLWGLRQRRGYVYRQLGYDGMYLPDNGGFIGYWRMRDWLRLLNFEVESARFGCYRPAVNSQKWLDRFEWMDATGERLWPIFGAVYFLVAVKRVRGMRLLESSWKTLKVPAAVPAVAANKKPASRFIVSV